jgi:hypothetical protein
MDADAPLDPAQVTNLPAETEGAPVELLISGVLDTPAGPSQLTKCSLEGVVFYVRENGGGGIKWLDLCAPDFYWQKIAGIVKCEDSLEREVRRSDDFTAAWAEQLLSNAKKE